MTSPQEAIEDTENASATVKGWKSSGALRLSELTHVPFRLLKKPFECISGVERKRKKDEKAKQAKVDKEAADAEAAAQQGMEEEGEEEEEAEQDPEWGWWNEDWSYGCNSGFGAEGPGS